MEEGFAAIDSQQLFILSGKKQFYLVRVPHEITFDQLEGVQLDLKSSSKEIKTNGGKRLRMQRDSKDIVDSVRPIIFNEVDCTAGISKPFSAALTFIPSVPLPSKSLGPLPVEVMDSYAPKPQVDFLQVRAMPIGSTSTIEELLERSREMGSKRKTALEDVEEVVFSGDIEKENKKAKKDRKEKKDKKDKKLKKHKRNE